MRFSPDIWPFFIQYIATAGSGRTNSEPWTAPQFIAVHCTLCLLFIRAAWTWWKIMQERDSFCLFLSRATNPWYAQYEMCICVCAFESLQYLLLIWHCLKKWLFFSVNGEKRVCCLSGRSTSVIKWLASCQIPLSLIKSRIILLMEVVLEKANSESYCYIWSQKHTHIRQMLHQPSVT